MNPRAKRILKEIIREWGNARNITPALMKEVKEDFFANKEMSLQQKRWSYKRGFLSGRIKTYGLTEENHHMFLSDFDYLKLQPINGRFSIWIDDKLTMKYILHPFDQYLPRYYYQLMQQSGSLEVIRLMDGRTEFSQDPDGIIGLLETEQALALKRLSGYQGAGFYKLAYSDQSYYINDQPVQRDELRLFLSSLDNYLVTEYLIPHKSLGAIWGQSANVIRLLTIKADHSAPQVIGSFIRFGRSGSGPVEHQVTGGLIVNVDLADGHFSHGIQIENNEFVQCRLHPDTKAPMEGDLPYWDEMKTTVLKICDYLPQLKLIGFDVVVTDQGFKIIEMNSAPSLRAHNYFMPFNKDEAIQDFFATLKREKAGRKV